jgi:hypothetical protein
MITQHLKPKTHTVLGHSDYWATYLNRQEKFGKIKSSYDRLIALFVFIATMAILMALTARVVHHDIIRHQPGLNARHSITVHRNTSSLLSSAHVYCLPLQADQTWSLPTYCLAIAKNGITLGDTSNGTANVSMRLSTDNSTLSATG